MTWVNVTNVAAQPADISVGTVSVSRSEVVRILGGGRLFSDLLVTKRVPPAVPPTIMFIDGKSTPLVPANPGDPALYLHYARPGAGGIISDIVHLMVKSNANSDYVYMGVYDVHVADEDVATVRSDEWRWIPLVVRLCFIWMSYDAEHVQDGY